MSLNLNIIMEKLGLRCTIMNSIDLIKNITYSIYYNMGNISKRTSRTPY